MVECLKKIRILRFYTTNISLWYIELYGVIFNFAFVFIFVIISLHKNQKDKNMAKTLFGIVRPDVKTYDKRRGVTKPVLQIKDGVVINRFDSIVEAGRSTNILAASISDVCRGKNKTTGGYVWRYADYDMPEKKKRTTFNNITALKTTKKGPFKVVITELCDTEEDAKLLLNSIIKTGTVNKKSARIIQTRNRNKGVK